jgi:putative inorganic carbon (hco3(-)) transporter
MEALSNRITFYSVVVGFIVISALSWYFNFPYLLVLPFIAAIAYLTIFDYKLLFWIIVFATPLSVNFEDLDIGGIGISVPTDPLLLLLLCIIGAKAIINNPDKQLLQHPISLGFIFYFAVVLFTTIFSSNPIVSIKFFLSKLWLILPVYYMGYRLFKEKKNIYTFLWLYLIAFLIVILYTLIRHMAYGFSEPAGHWVMNPFYKDHTSYGAIFAMFLPIVVGLYLINKPQSVGRFILICIGLIMLVGLYFSYTRAAWLSVVFGLGVFALMYFKVKFKYLADCNNALLGTVLLALNWHEIQYQLAKNKSEHATEDFEERLQSMSNISTDASNLERLNRWNCAIAMFKERPIVGWGPGTYMFEYAAFQHSKDITIISTNFSDGGNAHSEYLGPLSESGILGLLSILILVGVIFYKGIFLYTQLDDHELKIILASVIVGLSTYFIHGVLNNYLDTDKASIPVWGFAAIIVAIDMHYKKRQLNKAVSSK